MQFSTDVFLQISSLFLFLPFPNNPKATKFDIKFEEHTSTRGKPEASQTTTMECEIRRIKNGCELKVPLKQRMFEPIRINYDLVHDLCSSISSQHSSLHFIVITYPICNYTHKTTFCFSFPHTLTSFFSNIYSLCP